MVVSSALRSICDQAITNLLTALTLLQAQHLAATGRYAQLLCTHSTPPAEGKETTPDQAKATREGVASSWTAMRQAPVTVGEGLNATTTWQTADVKLPATLPCAFSVDTYDAGDAGKGWVLCALVVSGGVLYRRCVSGAGPEKRDMDWQPVGAAV